MTITLAGIETSIGAAIHKAAAVFSSIKGVLDTVTADVDKIAPTAEKITAFIPGAAGAGVAESAVVAILNAVDAAADAAGAQAASGVTVSLPAELMADFLAAKTAILAAVAPAKVVP